MAEDKKYLAWDEDLQAHVQDESNPHSVTKAQVGLGNVDNTSDTNKPVSTAQATAIADAKKAGTDAQADIDSHTANKSNPHGVTAAQVGADAKGTAASAVSSHNTNTSAHNDIRDLIAGLTSRLNALANSDDTTLDQMKEVVDYIKANRTLIESITTNKVNVTDIIDNLTTNVANKPLSAAQGVALKALIDALDTALDGKAPSSHNHSASNITSGTLSSDRLPTVPVSKGGTGATTAAAALTALGAASAGHKHTAVEVGAIANVNSDGSEVGLYAQDGVVAVQNMASNDRFRISVYDYSVEYKPHPANATSFNDFVATGVYYMKGTITDNMPPNTSTFGVMQVNTDGGYITQMYRDVVPQYYNGALFIRSSDGGSVWSDWLECADASKVYGEHNKPSGTYSGNNGSQTIDTSGVGDVILVQLTGSGGGFAIVTKSGAIGKLNSNNTFVGLADTEAKFIDGVLTLNSSNYAVNRSGYGYNWQVL